MGLLLTSERVVSEVFRFLGEPAVEPRGWLNIYGAGENIDWHRDASGEVQVLSLLESPPHEGQGQLLLEGPEGPFAPQLEVGDGLIFSATATAHATTPIDEGRRISAVMRFFSITSVLERRNVPDP